MERSSRLAILQAHQFVTGFNASAEGTALLRQFGDIAPELFQPLHASRYQSAMLHLPDGECAELGARVEEQCCLINQEVVITLNHNPELGAWVVTSISPASYNAAQALIQTMLEQWSNATWEWPS